MISLRVIAPVVLIAGGALATVLAVRSTTATVAASPVAKLPPPPASPFRTSIACTGIVEPRSESLQIATEIAGVVVEVPITPGDNVEQGAVLFRLDDRDANARLQTAKASLASAVDRRDRLARLPRPESLPPLRAAVSEAEALLASARNEASRLRSASDARAVASIELERQEFAANAAASRLAKAQAELAETIAGAWEPDLKLADADVQIERAKVREIETELARLVVRAPTSGRVLERNVRVGQFAEPRNLSEPLVVLGDTSVLHVRVDIDETEAWRFSDGAPAVAMVRGNPSLTADLTFERSEPVVAPKKSLTGASTERTDTRVLRVIYAVSKGGAPLRVGQLLDVRIQAPSSEPDVGASAPATAGEKVAGVRVGQGW